ncbi:MAG: C45 family autoproteolytic acyltransferase/hydolase [Anaerolineae bacterium]
MPPIRILKLSGSHYDMGYQHGTAYADDIREITEERIRLCSEETWTGRSLPREQVLALAEECLEAHWAYAPELMEQLEGISAASGVSLRELIITNGFTDFADTIYNINELAPANPIFGNECTAFMARNKSAGYLGQTWDMHATATPYVIVLEARPKDEPAFYAFTLTGCIAMIGMNEAGIAVGINNLAGADGQIGVTWPFVCRKILAQSTIEDALDCITSAPLAGAHNYMVMDAQGKAYNVEAMSTTYHIEPMDANALTHANICLAENTRRVERPISEESLEDSETRRLRAETVLAEASTTVETLMRLTQDRSDARFSVCSISEPPFYSETCGAVIMRPATRDFWGVWGLPTENPYEHFRL